MSWQCSNCRTEVELQFKVCWNCGTDQDGQLDASFSPELDADDLDEDPEVPRIVCTHCGYQGKVHFTTQNKTGLEWLVSGFVSVLVSQRSWIHFCHQVCPHCESNSENLKSWSGNISESNEEVWKSATEKESRLAAKNRNLIYLVFGCTGLAIFVLWFAMR